MCPNSAGMRLPCQHCRASSPELRKRPQHRGLNPLLHSFSSVINPCGTHTPWLPPSGFNLSSSLLLLPHLLKGRKLQGRQMFHFMVQENYQQWYYKVCIHLCKQMWSGVHFCERIANNGTQMDALWLNSNPPILYGCLDKQPIWSHLPPGHSLAGIDFFFFFWKEQDKEATAEIYCSVCRISVPSMRKRHFSSILVHWLGPGGKKLRVWYRIVFLSSKSVLNVLAVSSPEGCTSRPDKLNTEMMCTS